MKLSPHQRRVVAALWALTVEHQERWWSRDDIGSVVGAGGYHQVIQLGTMARLKGAGLVQTEWSSWPAELQAMVTGCGCACFCWGLTTAGREAAKSLNVVMDAATQDRVARQVSQILRRREKLDEDEAMARLRARIERSIDEREDLEDGEGWKYGEA